jgi:hypothetical protein
MQWQVAESSRMAVTVNPAEMRGSFFRNSPDLTQEIKELKDQLRKDDHASAQ